MARPKNVTLEYPEINTDIVDDFNRKYVYVLAEESNNDAKIFNVRTNERVRGPKYPIYRNLLLRSSIIWDGSDLVKDEKGNRISGQPAGRRLIRYYDGCTTLFVDDQPKDKETIDAAMAGTRQLFFVNGHLDVFGYDFMLKQFLDWTSNNENSPYRVRGSRGIFKLLDIEAQREVESKQLDLMFEAMSIAKTCDTKKMLTHARFLGIADVDLKTQNKLSASAIRTEYRRIAKENPKYFVETFNDKTIQVKTWIEMAIEAGDISTTLIPNNAVWVNGNNKGAGICDISGLKSHEGILNKLIEFSQLPDGNEFLDQLKVQYE